MGLKEDLEEEVAEIFREQWSVRDGQQVPDPEDLLLNSNDAVKLKATVLYADMSDSTKLVDKKTKSFAAEVYKSYLTCAAQVLKAEGGTITAYDGDRIMAVFIGDSRDDTAARAGLKLNYVVQKVVNPAVKHVYTDAKYELNHVVGIDRSSLFAARIGVRNDNDIVWVGRAANHAAKLSSLDRPGYVYITDDVHAKLTHKVKYGSTPPRSMWEERTWNDKTVYRSSWTWGV
jgi:class 3 adenylate cyclase